MIVGVPREMFPEERRVALVPGAAPLLTKVGVEVLVERGAGEPAGFPDRLYEERGVRLATDRGEVFESADVILQVRGLGANPEAGRADLGLMRPGQTLVAFLDPLTAPQAIREIAEAGVRAFAMELIPRITRAQSMDALTSMATISGYKAVLLAAESLPRMFPMLMTVAGTIHPARVLVIGAGVAGLQAIATARRLGAEVQGSDVRPAVQEQVESLGARFVAMPLDTGDAEVQGGYARAMDDDFYRQQRDLMAQVVSESDVVITTAAVPGKRAPVLITGEMVEGMKPGSVIVDLAAERGGNCELTRPGETTTEHGVTIIGPTNLPSTVPHDASQMYARNVASFVLQIVEDGTLSVDMENEVVRDTLVSCDGEVVHPVVRKILGLPTTSGGNERKAA